MKNYIVTCALILLFSMVFVFNFDMNMHRHEINKLKFSCNELSITGSLFIDESGFSNGLIIFNQMESLKAIHHQVKALLKLDDNLIPLSNSYWSEQITYNVLFYDDSNTIFPYLYIDPVTLYTKTFSAPTVVVRVNAGIPRYRLNFLNLEPQIRSSAHVWNSR